MVSNYFQNVTMSFYIFLIFTFPVSVILQNYNDTAWGKHVYVYDSCWQLSDSLTLTQQDKGRLYYLEFGWNKS